MMMPHVAAPQYPRSWVQVHGPNIGAHFVGPSSAQQVPIASVIEVRVKSMARRARRIGKKKKDDESKKRVDVKHKPHKIKIKPRGDTDRGCDGKNDWDETIKTLIPRILDISVMEWEGLRNYCTPSPLKYALTIKTWLEVELLCSVV
jgi:hypothetical protein